MQRITGALLSAIVMAGCATLSQEDCRRGDWYGLGIKDGFAGEPVSRLYEHSKACYEYGIAVQNDAYLAGREQGLRDYCRLDNAFTVGLSGRPYHHVCPPAIDGLFARYHAAAYAVHQDRAELDGIDSELSSKEHQLRDKKLSDRDRHKIHDDIRSLDRKHDRFRDELYYHERQLEDLRREAQSYRW
ncbi:MAG: DUF2799 domain-containing protein [Methylomonas sp.]